MTRRGEDAHSTDGGSTREERLAEQLRRNLRRRKAQAKARKTADEGKASGEPAKGA